MLRSSRRTCAGVVAAAGGLSPAVGSGLEEVSGNWQASFESNMLSADGGWVTGQVLSPNGGAVLGR